MALSAVDPQRQAAAIAGGEKPQIYLNSSSFFFGRRRQLGSEHLRCTPDVIWRKSSAPPISGALFHVSYAPLQAHA